jgi:hypothetical protein
LSGSAPDGAPPGRENAVFPEVFGGSSNPSGPTAASGGSRELRRESRAVERSGRAHSPREFIVHDPAAFSPRLDLLFYCSPFFPERRNGRSRFAGQRRMLLETGLLSPRSFLSESCRLRLRASKDKAPRCCMARDTAVSQRSSATLTNAPSHSVGLS